MGCLVQCTAIIVSQDKNRSGDFYYYVKRNNLQSIDPVYNLMRDSCNELLIRLSTYLILTSTSKSYDLWLGSICLKLFCECRYWYLHETYRFPTSFPISIYVMFGHNSCILYLVGYTIAVEDLDYRNSHIISTGTCLVKSELQCHIKPKRHLGHFSTPGASST